ncbi:MAG: TonB-dependent receptor [Chitinophagaceae bacterium]
MQNRIFFFFIIGICASNSIAAQVQKIKKDSLTHSAIYLPEINIVGKNSKADILNLPEVVGTSIFAGKKNSLVIMDNLNASVVNNNMRQVMAKIPGIHIWESDGSGIQIGIAARGLSPNRSWEFNIRQNGYDISADPFGYPESYYTPQLQAVQRIQVVRGSGALQYGPQFGGMVNFLLRDGSDINKPLQFETQNTVGSFGLFNTYNAIGGETKKINYYAFFDHRNANGWRQNSRYFTNTGFANMHYKLSNKLRIGVEYMHWNMRSQQPGGLSDKQFEQDARQSLRGRNWFDITWQSGAVTADYHFKSNNRLNIKLYTIKGARNSIGYLRPIDIKDSINPATGRFNNRTIDIDKYNNVGIEARYLSDYRIGKLSNTISTGLRYFSGKTDRLKNGIGDTGSGYNINHSGIYPSVLDMRSRNAAVFAENIIRFNEHFILIPGIRYEYLETLADGRISINANGSENKIRDEKRTRQFLLLGAGAEYHIAATEIYANYAQAYRPILFSDLTVSPSTEIVDPQIKDANGYNIDLGYRGKVQQYLYFDVSGFYLRYNNRIGVITQQKTDGTFYNYRTNLGSSNSKGIEALVEFDPIKAFVKKSKFGTFSLFISASLLDAKYGNFPVITKNGNVLVENNLRNKKVENSPSTIVRSGITWNYAGLSLTGQMSYSGETFSDANNTSLPSTNAQTGLIPAYTIADFSITYKLLKYYSIKAGINNLADKKYFTRRAGGYPGPGLMPADARNFYISVGAKF